MGTELVGYPDAPAGVTEVAPVYPGFAATVGECPAVSRERVAVEAAGYPTTVVPSVVENFHHRSSAGDVFAGWRDFGGEGG